MSGSPQVTNASAFKKGSLGIQIVLAIVTLGLYGLYWVYSTADQLNKGTNADISPGIVLIAMFIPFGALYSFWKVSNASEAVTDQSAMVLFLLFIFFGPLSWYWIQSGINSVAPQ